MIAPQANAGFVANMEDVLEVYQRPHNPQRPVVCLDETTKQMIAETRPPFPRRLGARRGTITNMNAMAWPVCS